MISKEIRLIAVLPASAQENDLVDMCLATEQGGATAVQVRLKEKPAGHLLRVTERLVSVLTVPVYVNDRADVARLAGAAGAHVGADDLLPDTIRRVLARPFRVGVSVGSPAEAEAAIEADADYWSVGPFRTTSTKPNAGDALGVEGFKRLAVLCPANTPVIAIGGIAADNLPEVLRGGAQGVAVVNAIFGQTDVEGATRRLRAILDEAFG